ncbi:hypothetical protein FDP41_012946 [Naegleria fowleri]|uniref:Peptidase S49 domain-containing protein n=2 Tax=Naegleria fowleri TaxID=5763 RepID=A0A6A5C5N5_NAEFO|nr:uncharacterized protein FDP41_012946 [Naegleria fowleri]KAF0981158.1 hypothetical protein FDP41_012946 [Naegleria fowleri]CAG4717143.1 unnamed protein product [Naegleria fowleri]
MDMSTFTDYVTKTVQQVYDKGRGVLEHYGIVEKPVQPNTHDPIRNFIGNHPYITTSIVSLAVSSSVKFILRQLRKRVSPHTVLEIDLEDLEFTAQPVTPSLAALFSQGKTKMHYLTFVDVLKVAKQNPNIVGLVVYFQGSSHNPFSGLALAHLSEMRKALFDFKQHKTTIAHTHFFSNTVNYYFASACEKIYIGDQGLTVLNGFQLRNFFLKQLLDKAEIEPYVVKRAEYKLAMNTFTESKYSEQHKEQVETLAKDLFDTIIKDISETREKNATSVREWFDIGVFGASAAVEHKVVDGVKHRDEMLSVMADSLNVDSKKINLLYIQKYLQQKLEGNPLDYLNPKKKSDNLVAIIYASGAIVRGRPQNPQDTNMNSDVLIDAIYKARKNTEVKVILLRVDSPGGEVFASEHIRRELELAKTEDKKKIVVSMGGVAASGGYWISSVADKIVAHPFTITGSIGVIMGKFFLGDFFANKLGITNDAISTNKNSSVFSYFDRVTEQQTELFNNVIDEFYDSFIEKVSQARNISKDDLKNKIAKGKVYFGQAAKEVNLVDQVGDFYDAVKVAKEVAGMQNEPHLCVFYPKKKSLSEALLSSQAPTNSRDRAFKSGVSVFEPFYAMLQSLSGLFKVSSFFAKHSSMVDKYVQFAEKAIQANNGEAKAELETTIEF